MKNQNKRTKTLHAARFLFVFLILLGAFFVFSGKANAATNVYYSVGQNTDDHKTLGVGGSAPTITLSGYAATLSVGQTAPNMGVGDLITYDGGSCFISAKTDADKMHWNCQNATGGTAPQVTEASVTSITHAFASLNAAVGDTPGIATLLGTSDLTSGSGYILNIPCYYDSGSDPGGVRINGWTTGINNYIRIYTATSTTSEVNQSQRHNGVWSNTTFNSVSTDAARPIIDIREDYVRVDGLQIKRIMTTGSAAHAFYIGALTVVNNKIEISDNIVVGIYGVGAGGHGITPQNANANTYIWNNIIYGFSGSASVGGIYSYGTTYAYNNTLYGNGRGLGRDTGTFVAKNNIAYNNILGGDYTGTFSSLSTHNLSKDNSAPAINTYYRGKTLTFTNTGAGTEDLHLVSGDTDALNKGTDLSDDPDDFLDMTDDIDGQTRFGTWDLGADDLYVAPDTEDPTITAFTIPATATSRNISISTFEADDNVAVTGYLITESATTPEVSDPSWSATPQTTYTITGTGTSHTLRAWVMDGSENISAATNASITITPTAASCSQTDIQAELDMSQDGDTILVPAGNCTWSSAVTVGKSINIVGAGSGEGGTKLTAVSDMLNGFFYITGFTASSLVRVTGFTFTVPITGTSYAIKVMNMTGGGSNGEIRIDHNTFHHGYTQIFFGHTKGLIDNNTFYNGIKSVAYTSIARTLGDESWESLAAGTANALYIEDNHFVTDENYGPAYTQEKIGTSTGGKLVIRYNEFNGDSQTLDASYDPFMAHGNADGGCNSPGIGYWEADAGGNNCIRRGQSVIEFYSNAVHSTKVGYLYQTRGSGAYPICPLWERVMASRRTG